jgi:hypothetical protein
LKLQWPGVPARRYRVFWSEDLRNWYPLQCPVVAEGAMGTLLDAAIPSAGQRFYRVQALPD